MMNKRLRAFLPVLLAVILLLPAHALAADRIDPAREIKLTVSARDGETPLCGEKFDIYLVADAAADGTLMLTDNFARYGVSPADMDDGAWRALASTLEGYILRDHLSPADSGQTDEQGLVSFPNQPASLTPGLYLVLGHVHAQDGNRYTAAPFLIMLPGSDGEGGQWNYAVTAEAKHGRDPDEETEDVTRKVLKVWDDGGNEQLRPREITVQLLRDGVVYDTVVLSDENGWRYTWTDLDGSSQWTVVEQVPEGYTVRITQEGITFVITNTHTQPDLPPVPDHPSEPGLPQTGQLWWPVPVFTALGMLLIAVSLIRRRGRDHEK